VEGDWDLNRPDQAVNRRRSSWAFGDGGNLFNFMSNTIHFQLKGSDEQAEQFRENCRRTELLFAGTLMKRFGIEMTDENAELVAGWFKSTRDMAVANWISSGIQASTNEHPRPLVVCLCGSTRFVEAFRKASLERTLAGEIVLSIGCYKTSDSDILERGELTPDAKVKLDELHKRKIDLCDEVLVLNVGGYLGESTRSEVAYALEHGKPIRWLEDPSEELCREFGVIPCPNE
jgi:hypothetical protein